MSDYTHDDAMRDLACSVGREDIAPAFEPLECSKCRSECSPHGDNAVSRVLAHITTLEAQVAALTAEHEAVGCALHLSFESEAFHPIEAAHEAAEKVMQGE